MMNWFEELPEQCPPKEAFNPEGFSFYRFSSSENPDLNDFLSHRYLHPTTVFNNVPECIARSLSVYDSLEKCINLRKLPRHRNKWKSILELKLNADDGLVMKTFPDPNHYSWWRSNSFKLETAKIVP